MAKRITISLLIGLFVSSALLIAGAGYQAYATARKDFDEQGRQNALLGARMIAHILNKAIANGIFSKSEIFGNKYVRIEGSDPPTYHSAYDYYFDRNFLSLQKDFLEAEPVYYTYMVNNDGYVPVHTDESQCKKMMIEKPSPIELEYDSRFDHPAIRGGADGFEYYEYSWPIIVQDRKWGEFRVGIPVALVGNEVQGRVITAAGLTAACSAALAALIYWVVRKSLRPLGELSKATARVAEGDLTARSDYTGQDELGRLAHSFNKMAEALQVRTESLQENERKFRAIFDQTFQFVGLMTSDGILQEVNKTALNFIKANRNDVIGVPFWNTPWWSHSIDVQKRIRLAVARAAEGEFVRFETTICSADGAVTAIDFSIKPVTDEFGKVVMLIPEGRDISEIKRAEEKLRKTHDELEQRVEKRTAELSRANENLLQIYRKREELEKIINRSPAIVFLWQAKEGWPVEYVSDSVRQFGYTPEDFYSGTMPYASIIYPEDLPRIGREVGEYSAQPDLNSFAQEYRIITKSGEVRWIDDRTWLRRNRKGEVTHYQGIILDITERKHAEEQLQRAKEAAEEATKAKSEFLAKMSHEIRTPMNGIIGMTELALDTDLTEEQRGYLDMVKDSAEALLVVINDILDFSKIEAGKVDFDVIAFSLRDCIGQVLTPLGIKADEKSLELMCDIAPNVPDAVMGDPGRFRQVLTNLIGNAVKFTEKGDIFVKVELESATEENVTLHVSVADTGIGIDEKDTQKIFEAFEQVDSSATRKYGGTGLGLSITSELVKMMGGKVWVDSRPGIGSTFHFTVNFELQKSQEQPEAPVPVDLTDMPVLVVDDNRMNRMILEKILLNWNMRPECAEGGPMALAAMERKKSIGDSFPLVILDMQMPGMDGFEVAKRIKQDPALAGATIMMLSSAGRRGDAALCRKLGIAAYLTKPIKQSDLMDAIMTALGSPATRDRVPLITGHFIREKRRKLRILLAEDNLVNQKLAVRILQKWGHDVAVAENGREILEAWENGDFDLILMDVQMPEMDGLEAAMEIRRREQARANNSHIPIIAMTAHTMKGDSRRCFDAGMDGYVGKPIRPETLFDEIDKVIQMKLEALKYEDDMSEEIDLQQEELTGEECVFDRAELVRRLGCDDEVVTEVVELFMESLPQMYEDIRKKVEECDFNAAKAAAHSLKGAAANVAAKAVSSVSARIEKLAVEENIAQMSKELALLNNEINRLREYLSHTSS